MEKKTLRGNRMTISEMDLRRVLAEYYVFLQAKFYLGAWQDEKMMMEAIWYLNALRGSSILSREESPEHVTVSGVILSGDHKYVLMNFHKKHGRWKHWGGHLERDDKTLSGAAMREITEETGLSSKKFIISPISKVGDAFERPLDVFLIGQEKSGAASGKESHANYSGEGGAVSGATQQKHVDIDIRYLFVTNGKPKPVLSSESIEARWVPVSEVMNLVGREDPCNIERLLLKARFMGGDQDPKIHKMMFGKEKGEVSGFFGRLGGKSEKD